MKTSYLLPFFIIGLLLISFGCVKNNKQDSAKAVTENNVGIISYTYSLNGKNSTSITLLKGEQAELGTKLTNMGKRDMKNVTLKLISCLDPLTENNYYNKLSPGETAYFSFTLLNDLSLGSQQIKCPSTVRVYFYYLTKSYTDIAVVGGEYSDEPPKLISYSDSDLLTIHYQLPQVFRVVEGSDKIIAGNLIIKNVGDGIVDYTEVGKTNEISEILIRTPKNIELTSIGGFNVNLVKLGSSSSSTGGGTPAGNCGLVICPKFIGTEDNNVNVYFNKTDDYNIYVIFDSDLNNMQKEILTKMSIGQGNTGSLIIPIKFKYVGPLDSSSSGSEIDRIETSVYYGYSYDLFKFNLVLGSNLN